MRVQIDLIVGLHGPGHSALVYLCCCQLWFKLDRDLESHPGQKAQDSPGSSDRPRHSTDTVRPR